MRTSRKRMVINKDIRDALTTLKTCGILYTNKNRPQYAFFKMLADAGLLTEEVPERQVFNDGIEVNFLTKD